MTLAMKPLTLSIYSSIIYETVKIVLKPTCSIFKIIITPHIMVILVVHMRKVNMSTFLMIIIDTIVKITEIGLFNSLI
jgi:hypothetical protein